MSSEPTNADRRERARTALQQYIEAKGEVYEESSSEVADLIVDLLHLTAEIDERQNGPELAVNLALTHFNVEQDEARTKRRPIRKPPATPRPK